jgi:hypothetical protein
MTELTYTPSVPIEQAALMGFVDGLERLKRPLVLLFFDVLICSKSAVYCVTQS